jgi:hypothetical protein
MIRRHFSANVRRITRRCFCCFTYLFAWVLVASCAISIAAMQAKAQQNPVVDSDASGQVSTYSKAGFINTNSAFFQNLGSNGRTCASCHVAANGWTITPPSLQTRFNATSGLDPVFNSFDGTNCPGADQSTLAARQAASSLLLSKGLIRIGLPIPANAEFTVAVKSDPTGCALVNNVVSIYRRPLPSTSVSFLSTVMWDGRENSAGRSIHDDLISQARDATLGHAQAAESPTDAQLEDIVAFQMGLFTAQSKDNNAGPLDAQQAQGGPINLANQNFFLGINDAFSPGFNPAVFTIYQPWRNINSGATQYITARQSIARGEDLFNNKPIAITGVAGINDVVNQAVFMGTCTTCHDSPNVGDHSVSAPLNIGVTAGAPVAPLNTQGLPVLTLTCASTRGRPVSVDTTDPGRALITGKCIDIGKTKGPILRGLAARAPYFHNGSGTTLSDVIDFYNNRFAIGLTAQEKADLVNVLKAF